MDTAQESAKSDEPWTAKDTLGCVNLLAFPALLGLLFVASRVEKPWVTYPVLGLTVAYLGYRARGAFRVPEKSPEGLVGGTPKEPPSIPAQVTDQATKLGHLRAGESVVAALDDSWKDDGSKGLVVTERRLFTYQSANLRLDLPFSDIESLFTRTMWYPGAGILGRGEFIGRGPVIVLRLKFRMSDGATRRLRLSNYASDLHPVLAVLMTKLAGRVDVGRTLPGI